MADDWGSIVLRGWKEVNHAMIAPKLTESREHLDLSVSLFEAALDAAEGDSQFEVFIGLAHAYCNLADIDRDAAASCDHAETAVTLAECLVELWGEQNPTGTVNEELMRAKDALGCALRQRYIYLGNEEDCVRAIKLHRTCVEYDLSSKDLKATWNYHLSLALISLIRRSWTTYRLAEMVEAYNSGYAALRLSSWSNPLYLVTLCSFRVFMLLETKHHSIDWVKGDSSSGHASTSSSPDIAAFLHSITGIIGQQWLTMANNLNPSPYVATMVRLAALTVHLLDVNKDDSNDFERHARDAQILLFEQDTELDLRHSPYLLDLLGAFVRCRRLGLNHGDIIETLSAHLDLKLPGKVEHSDEATEIYLDLARHHYERPRLHYLIGESIYLSVSEQKLDAHRDPNYLPAIIHQRAALKLTPDGHPRQLQYLLSLAFALAGSAQSTGVINDSDLREFYDWMQLIVSLQEEKDSIARELSRGDEFEKIVPLLFSLALDEQDKVVEWGLRYIYYRHTLGSVGSEQHVVAGVAFASLSVRWALTIQKRANKCTETSRSHIDEALLVWSDLHDDYPQNPSITFGYGAALSIMANHLTSLDNKKSDARQILNTSIAYMQESLGTEPPSTFLEIESRQLLARTHINRHRLHLELQIPAEDDLDQAIELVQVSVASAIGKNMPATIIHSIAEEWSKWAVEFQHDSVQEAYQTQIAAFIQLAWVGFDFSNRLKALKAAGQTLAADATTHALREGNLDLAIEQLEACRVVLFSSAVSTWNIPLSLKKSHPELVEKLGTLGIKIREMSHSYSEIGSIDPGRFTTSNDQMNDLAHKLRQLGIEWDSIVTEVRLVEGHENFLQAIPFDTLAQSNRDRLVASVVTSEQYDCCHVLFLIQGQPHVLELSLSPQKVKEIYDQFKMVLRFKFGDGRDEESRIMQRFNRHQVNPDHLMAQVLEDLWSHLMQRIIEFIKQKIGHQGDSLLRISINATGHLSSLPLHAAGVYDETGRPIDRQSVLAHAICSYAPSLASLASKPEVPAAVTKVLALGAGQNLKHVKKEVEKVAGIFRGKGATVVQLVGTDFTIDTVKQQLQDSQAVHFASHGVQDLSDPLKSRLLFHGNSRLTLEESMQLYLPKAKLAVLFACETAQGDENLTNEALHLAGAMLSIGFTGAVGTLWPMIDADGIPACQVFYETLLEGEGKEIDYSRAGFALHKAVCALRDDGVGLLRWATFAHFGQ